MSDDQSTGSVYPGGCTRVGVPRVVQDGYIQHGLAGPSMIDQSGPALGPRPLQGPVIEST